jgi:thiol-disulfide isomerase/thioredoxin
VRINQDRRRFLSTAAATLAGLEVGMLGATKSLVRGMGIAGDRELQALRGATTWLNTPPLSPDGLRGKVVLVDFCTYTCINWLRTLPYVRAWAEKYGEHGLVVIGAHTPEFVFERDVENVRRAIAAMRVQYPIAVDNDYAVWNGFSNQFWPALYLLDAKGTIRFTHFGEGAYDQSERSIQRLLVEAGAGAFSREVVTPDARGIEAPADWDNLKSGETYLGSAQAEHFVRNATRLRLNEWTLAGDWTLGSKAVTLQKPDGKIDYRFHARDVHLVMGPAGRGASARFVVRLDGQAPGTAHGADVDEQGRGVVAEQRTYQLIRQQRPIVDRQFEIEFLDPGVEAFCFTFG